MGFMLHVLQFPALPMERTNVSIQRKREVNQQQIKDKNDELEVLGTEIRDYDEEQSSLYIQIQELNNRMAQVSSDLDTSKMTRDTLQLEVQNAMLENRAYDFGYDYSKFLLNTEDKEKIFGRPGVSLTDVQGIIGVSSSFFMSFFE